MNQTDVDLSNRRDRVKFKMAEARQELIATLLAITPEQMALPTQNEGWNVGQVAAHIASAEGGMEPIARRILDREPNQRESNASFDLNYYNNRRIEKRAGQSIAELVAELERSRVKMLEILEAASDEDLDAPGYHPYAGDITLYGLFVVIYKHERQHAGEIKQAILVGEK